MIPYPHALIQMPKVSSLGWIPLNIYKYKLLSATKQSCRTLLFDFFLPRTSCQLLPVPTKFTTSSLLFFCSDRLLCTPKVRFSIVQHSQLGQIAKGA